MSTFPLYNVVHDIVILGGLWKYIEFRPWVK